MYRLMAGLLCVLGVARGGWAQGTAAPAAGAPATQAAPAIAAPAADDPNGVGFALKRYIAVFNSHDAAKLAELWSADGVHVDKATGERTMGREALAAGFTTLFAASPQIALSGDIEGVRLLGADAALVDGTCVTAAPGSEPEASSFSALLVKRDGKWLMDSVHESALPLPETPRQALAPLAWMVGQWQDAGDDAKVFTTINWSPSDAFLIRSYAQVREGDDQPFTGTQVIGWDPRAHEIRSWTFNSDGSFGDGTWAKSGDEWVVRTAQTLADGRAATGTQVIKAVDANSATVQTLGKEIDGVLEPASEPVTMVRVAEPKVMAPATAVGAGATPNGTITTAAAGVAP